MTMASISKLGNFTNSASYYDDRPRYDSRVLDMLSLLIRERFPEPSVADIGAGTGLLTRALAAQGFSGMAVEPNDAMREEGIRHSDVGFPFQWREGGGEATGLDQESTDWLLMGNAFHWTKVETALGEFHRVLRPGGYFTPIWVMLDSEHDEMVQSVDRLLREAIPSFSRHSDVVLKFIEGLGSIGCNFSDGRVFLDSRHTEIMSRARYLNMWRSRNDVQSALPHHRWEAVIDEIGRLLVREDVVLNLRTYAWIFESARTPY
ncbi:methyltransferase domain-containing protein [Sinorhizobium meliloti]|nr:methyltransferase domain-containing protein [Sinorhizobium meliloti]